MNTRMDKKQSILTTHCFRLSRLRKFQQFPGEHPSYRPWNCALQFTDAGENLDILVHELQLLQFTSRALGAGGSLWCRRMLLGPSGWQ